MLKRSLAVLLSACALALACAESPSEPEPQVTEDPGAALQPVSSSHLPGFPARHSDLAAAAQGTVITREQLARLWEQVHGRGTPAPTMPEVDFSREMVLFAAMGVRSRGGNSIRITSLRSEPDHLLVNVLAISPAASCPATTEIQSPVDAIRVTPRRRDVRFVQKDSVIHC